MITIRGKTVSVKPLTLTQVGQVIDSVRVLSGCRDLLEPIMRPHCFRVLAMSIKPHFPGASLEELAEELLDALTAEDLMTIVPIVFDLNHYAQFSNVNVQKEEGHV
jgi:hypothetical protein